VIIVPVKSRLTKDSHCTFLRLLPHIEKCSSADICDIGVLTRSFVFSSFYAANAMQPQASVTQIGQVARRHVLHTHTHDPEIVCPASHGLTTEWLDVLRMSLAYH
jgi:hypothetical protein